jgi:hypothetical protein
MQQPELDLNRQPKSTKRFLLSSNITVSILFSRGCLFSANVQDFSEMKALSIFSDKLPIFENKIPKNYCENIENSSRNAKPIALSLNSDAPITQINLGDARSAEVIYLKDVEAIVFRSLEEKNDFLSLSFSNYNILGSGVIAEVNPKAFFDEVILEETIKEVQDIAPSRVAEPLVEDLEEVVSKTLQNTTRDDAVDLNDIHADLEIKKQDRKINKEAEEAEYFENSMRELVSNITDEGDPQSINGEEIKIFLKERGISREVDQIKHWLEKNGHSTQNLNIDEETNSYE